MPSAVMLCLRTIHQPLVASEKRECAKCGHDVWITEESLKLAESHIADLLCEVCFLKSGHTLAQVRPLTKAQKGEML